MSTPKENAELERARRRSARAIPVYSGLLVFEAGVLWLLHGFMIIPVAVIVIVLGLTAFTLVFDILNYWVCGRRLQKTKDETRAN